MKTSAFSRLALPPAAACALLLAAGGALAAQDSPALGGQTVSRVLNAASNQAAVEPDASWSAANPKNFSGKVLTKAAFSQPAPARSYGAYVHFAPGARTYWHMHPLGQTLVVVSGTGLTQALEANGKPAPVAVVRAGDVVLCPPGVTHWHGAAPGSAMVHLAVSERDPANPVVWKEAVDEKAYRAGAERAMKGAPK